MTMSDEPVKRKRGRPAGWKKPVGQVTPLGRPRYVPSAEKRAIVANLLSVGERHSDIAHMLGISDALFAERFKVEITDARLAMRARFAAVVFAKALEGNVSMLRLAMDMTSTPEEEKPYQLPESKSAEPAAKEPKLGKKERLALAAQNPDVNTAMGELMARRAQGGKVS